MTEMDKLSSSALGPIPERRRMAGELKAPAERITSFLARWKVPVERRTPMAVLELLKRILSTVDEVMIVRFGGGEVR